MLITERMLGIICGMLLGGMIGSALGIYHAGIKAGWGWRWPWN